MRKRRPQYVVITLPEAKEEIFLFGDQLGAFYELLKLSYGREEKVGHAKIWKRNTEPLLRLTP
jgi:hypothetical protein